jgi:hypothetical protein
MSQSFFARCCLLGLLLLPCTAGARIIEVTPEENYVEILRTLQPGDELVFLPGIHEGHAVLTASGEAGRPITLRGVAKDGKLPELRYTGSANNLWRIKASHLIIRDLAFHSTHSYGMRIERADHITIDGCQFRECGGGDLSANSADVDGLRVQNCRFIGSPCTPVYIGHQDGKLAITHFVFERNIIDGSRITEGVGYGIQLKLNVRGGVIRENHIFGTQGPGIMVYGSLDAAPEDAQRVERNIIVGGRDNPGIVVGGGPALVQGNLLVGGRSGGIAVQNYGGRDILDGIRLIDNVMVLNKSSDLSVSGNARGLLAQGNRAWRDAEAGGFRGLSEGENDNLAGQADEALHGWVAGMTARLPDAAELLPAWQRLAPPPKTKEELPRLFDPVR